MEREKNPLPPTTRLLRRQRDRVVPEPETPSILALTVVGWYAVFPIKRESLCVPLPTGGHGCVTPQWREKRMKRYFDGGTKFDEWKSDPFLGLAMYIELQQKFGWEPFTKVFREYRTLPDAERPKTDDQRRDQWMVRFSKTVGRNLGPFFQAWGVPTSEKARKSIEDLPVWMPNREE